MTSVHVFGCRTRGTDAPWPAAARPISPSPPGCPPSCPCRPVPAARGHAARAAASPARGPAECPRPSGCWPPSRTPPKKPPQRRRPAPERGHPAPPVQKSPARGPHRLERESFSPAAKRPQPQPRSHRRRCAGPPRRPRPRRADRGRCRSARTPPAGRSCPSLPSGSRCSRSACRARRPWPGAAPSRSSRRCAPGSAAPAWGGRSSRRRARRGAPSTGRRSQRRRAAARRPPPRPGGKRAPGASRCSAWIRWPRSSAGTSECPPAAGAARTCPLRLEGQPAARSRPTPGRTGRP
mmetsp:Transcript_13673/g.40638  ORF Transcript_13673/g.40638 Transcript_13673/m.40638 type:complete len:294 (+) Transcript_13673:975-1856(+)